MAPFKYFTNLLILLTLLWLITLGWFYLHLNIHFSFEKVGLWMGMMLLTLIAIYTKQVQHYLNKASISQDHLGFGLLAWTLLLTTGLLYETGGTINPLVHLLLLPLALGMLILSSRYFIALAFLSAALYGLVNYHYVPVMSLKVQSLQAFFAWHLHGSMLVFILLVVFLAMFILPLKKRLEQQRYAIEQQRNQALQNEYLLSVASIASASAHQLSTPLNTLKLLESLLDNEVHTPMGKDLMKTYREQVQICTQALQGLRKRAEFAQTKNPQTISLQNFIQTLIEEFALLHPKSVLQTREPATNINLKIDESFKLAIMNLLDNAARYSPDSIVIEFQHTATHLLFNICDEGGGVPESELAHLGQQPLEEYHGIGMGVFLSRMIIERFQGKLLFSLIDKPKKGLKASVWLPKTRFDLS
ncbi:sensor histidine kinase [Thiosulfativibrio zosterae]|uniref:histidine kinase n=1 Tax=Thiosulfativibrio zosterae TaxID=2675053 RepID=A0A6F8PMX7_9GAMM|nr:HAMP domain-containing sensor histidine kinase [Thiosulfativibrio zosterae]BBP43350.1 two-component sensor histidine kinase [Thiosulfativibrio zosterae]